MAIATSITAALIAAGASGGAAVAGARSASGSARRAADVTDRSNRAVEEDTRLQREEDRRRWEAEQVQAQQDRAAQEEERAYRRSQDDYTRRLQEEREARQAPYRQASQAALGNLGQLLGIDMSGTPLNQSLSAPRTAPPVSQVPSRLPGAGGPVIDISQSGPMSPRTGGPQIPGQMARGSMGEMLGMPQYRRPLTEARV